MRYCQGLEPSPGLAETGLSDTLHRPVMNIRYDIDKENRIIIGIVSGQLHRDILLNLLAQLRIISSNNRGCNLLFDLRQTALQASQMDMYRIIDVVSAIIDLKDQLGDKIAHVVPEDKERVTHAEDIGSVAAIRGLNYQVFTDIERARNWLME